MSIENQTPQDHYRASQATGDDKEKAKSHKLRNRIVGAVAGVAVFATGGLVAKEVFGQSNNTEPRDVPSTSAPAVPGVSHETTTPTPEITLDDTSVEIGVLQADGSVKVYHGENEYIEANQVHDKSDVVLNYDSLGELLETLNTAGHITAVDPIYSAEGRDGDLARGYISDAAAKTLFKVTPGNSADSTGLSVDLGYANQIVDMGVFGMVNDNLANGKYHDYTVISTKGESLDPVPNSTEEAARVTLKDTTYDVKTKGVIDTKIIERVIHYDKNHATGTDYISQVEKIEN